jgi:hypothetical protein
MLTIMDLNIHECVYAVNIASYTRIIVFKIVY